MPFESFGVSFPWNRYQRRMATPTRIEEVLVALISLLRAMLRRQCAVLLTGLGRSQEGEDALGGHVGAHVGAFPFDDLAAAAVELDEADVVRGGLAFVGDVDAEFGMAFFVSAVELAVVGLIPSGGDELELVEGVEELGCGGVGCRDCLHATTHTAS